MSSNLEKLFQRLSLYEKDSTDSMEWAEYGYLEIDNLIEEFDITDWEELKKIWKDKTLSIRLLLVNHIYFEKEEFIDIAMKIMKEMIFETDEEMSHEAVRRFIWHFITSKAEYQGQETHYKVYVELKKIFATPIGPVLVKRYIDKNFLERLKVINKSIQNKSLHDEIDLFVNTFNNDSHKGWYSRLSGRYRRA